MHYLNRISKSPRDISEMKLVTSISSPKYMLDIGLAFLYIYDPSGLENSIIVNANFILNYIH